jgi:hypothetical protein
MSIDLFIRAIKPNGEHHEKMMQIYKMCLQASVSLPKEVEDYFSGEEPNELGVTIDHYDLPKECLESYQREYESGYKIDLSKLPKDVKYLEVHLS